MYLPSQKISNKDPFVAIDMAGEGLILYHDYVQYLLWVKGMLTNRYMRIFK